MQIPVFHDDQHGTAIITGAALINALELTGKRLADVKAVFVGAGAAAVTCAEQYVKLGIPREHIFMCDKFGLVYRGRPEDMDEWKGVFAQGTQPRSLAEVLKGADVVVGLSAKGVISKEMVATLAPNPILFALANPVPEILPEEAQSVRSDIIMATGRSDSPNQVNNVLGFRGIFRGALDVRAKAINDEMKLAASRALAELARQDVPESVSAAYGGQGFSFGRDYIIPKPFDPRVLTAVAPAGAEAAVESGGGRGGVGRAAPSGKLRRPAGGARARGGGGCRVGSGAREARSRDLCGNAAPPAGAHVRSDERRRFARPQAHDADRVPGGESPSDPAGSARAPGGTHLHPGAAGEPRPHPRAGARGAPRCHRGRRDRRSSPQRPARGVRARGLRAEAEVRDLLGRGAVPDPAAEHVCGDDASGRGRRRI